MRQCEYEEIYDPKLGMHVEKHIYGGGVITDTFKAVGKRLFKRAAKKTAEKTGEYAGNKAGDKIVELLSKKRNTSTPSIERNTSPPPMKMTQQEVDERINQILSGGRLRKRIFI